MKYNVEFIGVGISGSQGKKILNIIKSAFNNNINVNVSELFQKALILSDKDLTDDKLDELIKNKINSDTLYFILDDFPEKIIKVLKKDKVISDKKDEEAMLNAITCFRKRYLDIYNYVINEKLFNIKLVSLIEPDYIETILNIIKNKFNI